MGDRAPELLETWLTEYITLIIPQIPHKHYQSSLPVYSRVDTNENMGQTAERNTKNRGQEPILPLYSPNSGFDEAL